MPQAIAYVLAAVFTTASAAAITFAAYAISLVGTLALSSYQKRKAERSARAQFDAAQVDRLANVPGTVVPRELVLGRIRKGGHVFFKTSVGLYKELFIMCVALAEHEIDGVEQVYLNDQPVDINEFGQVTTAPYGVPATLSAEKAVPFGDMSVTLDHDPNEGSVTATAWTGGQPYGVEVACTVSGRVVTITDLRPLWAFKINYQYAGFNSFVRILAHLGSPSQPADGELMAMLPGTWTADHRASGVAYLVCHFAYNDTALPSGIPSVTARIRGAKMYDPRDGVTRFAENPALMMRHVMLHPRFGKRTSMTASEDARIIAAANACDTGISYFGSDWVQMFRGAGVFLEGAPARDVFDDLSQAMGGEWAYAAGEFFLRAGVYQLPVMELTDADLAVVQRSNEGSVSQSPITISPHRPRNEKVNMVAIRIWDQAANYIETPITPFRADALVADDGAELSQEVTMPAVFYAGQAYHIAGIMLRDSRDPLTVTLPFKMRAYPLELFDGVRLTLARYGWTSKEFRILGRTFSPEGLVQLTLKETTAAIFSYGAGFVPGGYAPNTGLPQPWDIHPPTIVSISSGEGELIVQNDGTIVNGVRVTWAPVLDQSILSGGSVELQYRGLPDGQWISVTVPGTAIEAKFTGVDDLAMILVRLRTRNSLAVSDWGVQKVHQVIGKTEPPPNIEDLSISGSVISWTLPQRVPDLAGYVFRFHYGNNLDWNSAAPLHTGVLTDSPYDLITRPGGVVTIMGKAIDTSGNESQVTANIVMNLGDPPVANVLEEWDFDALGWPYDASESSGWTIVGGDPAADAVDSFYGTDDQSFYTGDTEPLYEAGAYRQMTYVTSPITVNSALAGSIMTLVAQVQGTDLRIDYRLSGPGSFYGPDAASFYGPDAEARYGPPSAWMPWPGQLVAQNDSYQFRVTIGAGVDRGTLQQLVLTIDAPDIEETLADVAITAGGTPIPYSKPFTSIKTVQATLQANGSGAETVEINKSIPLTPVIRAFNSAHAAVSGATADITMKGY